MTDYQNELVMEHLDLVNWVIRTRISVPNRPLLTYDDFYAIGCEAICRAALKYQADSGEFAPFACRYRTIKGEHYECIEGTLVREQAGYARKRHTIVLALEDGSLEQRILEGRYKLKIGTDYRFYLKREPIAEIQIELPEILQPAIVVLGHEELSFSSGKQI